MARVWDPGKERKGRDGGPYILGREGKGKRIDDKTDPIFINRDSDCRLMCPFRARVKAY